MMYIRGESNADRHEFEDQRSELIGDSTDPALIALATEMLNFKRRAAHESRILAEWELNITEKRREIAEYEQVISKLEYAIKVLRSA